MTSSDWGLIAVAAVPMVAAVIAITDAYRHRRRTKEERERWAREKVNREAKRSRG